MDFQPNRDRDHHDSTAHASSPASAADDLSPRICPAMPYSNFENRRSGTIATAASTQETDMPNREGEKRSVILHTAGRDTLMNIAGVSGVAAKSLRPGQSLVVDLGLDSAELLVLARYQHTLGMRLRSTDLPSNETTNTDAEDLRRGRRELHGEWLPQSAAQATALIAADELLDLMVWEVLDLTLRRALSLELDETELTALIMDTRAELRAPPR